MSSSSTPKIWEASNPLTSSPDETDQAEREEASSQMLRQTAHDKATTMNTEASNGKTKSAPILLPDLFCPVHKNALIVIGGLQRCLMDRECDGKLPRPREEPPSLANIATGTPKSFVMPESHDVYVKNWVLTGNVGAQPVCYPASGPSTSSGFVQPGFSAATSPQYHVAQPGFGASPYAPSGPAQPRVVQLQTPSMGMLPQYHAVGPNAIFPPPQTKSPSTKLTETLATKKATIEKPQDKQHEADKPIPYRIRTSHLVAPFQPQGSEPVEKQIDQYMEKVKAGRALAGIVVSETQHAGDRNALRRMFLPKTQHPSITNPYSRGTSQRETGGLNRTSVPPRVPALPYPLIDPFPPDPKTYKTSITRPCLATYKYPISSRSWNPYASSGSSENDERGPFTASPKDVHPLPKAAGTASREDNKAAGLETYYSDPLPLVPTKATQRKEVESKQDCSVTLAQVDQFIHSQDIFEAVSKKKMEIVRMYDNVKASEYEAAEKTEKERLELEVTIDRLENQIQQKEAEREKKKEKKAEERKKADAKKRPQMKKKVEEKKAEEKTRKEQRAKVEKELQTRCKQHFERQSVLPQRTDVDKSRCPPEIEQWYEDGTYPSEAQMREWFEQLQEEDSGACCATPTKAKEKLATGKAEEKKQPEKEKEEEKQAAEKMEWLKLDAESMTEEPVESGLLKVPSPEIKPDIGDEVELDGKDEELYQDAVDYAEVEEEVMRKKKGLGWLGF